MDRINNELLSKDVFYEEIQYLNNEKSEILSNMIYDGYSYKIQFNDITNFNNTENIVKNLPYVDYSKCKNENPELSSDSGNKIIGINLFANGNSTNFNDVTTKFMNENGELIEDICDSYVVKFPVDKNEVNLTQYLEIMDEYGYDIMDPENKFFNELCTPFNHANNSDLVIADRKLVYNKSISCNNLGKKGNFTGIDKNGYVSCNFDDAPNQSHSNIETSIFDDFINSNYKIFSCIDLLIYKPKTNYSIFVFISFISIATTIVIINYIFSNILNVKNELLKNDIITILPSNIGKVKQNRNQNTFKNSMEIQNLNQYENNDYLHTEKSNDLKENSKSDNNKIECNSNVMYLQENQRVGLPLFKDSDRNLMNFDILENIDFIHGERKNSTFSEKNIDRRTNNFLYMSKTKPNTALTIKNSNTFEIVDVVNFSLGSTEEEKMISLSTEKKTYIKCKQCIPNTGTPVTLLDYKFLNEHGDIQKDDRKFYKYFWDDFKICQQFLNLIFMSSLVNPFRNRFALLSMSISIEIFLNAFFLDSYKISAQTTYKTNVGQISIGWKIFNDLIGSLWPAVITAIIISFISFIIEPPEKYVDEYKEGLLNTDEKLQDKSM